MIYNYGFSVVGKSHILKDTCCQDSHMIKELENGWIVAAVADGVGSAKNSQIGSDIAAKTVVEFCAEYMPWDYSVIGIKSMLRTAYNYAFKQIMRESEKAGEPIESYDTTLTTVIYDGHRIIYGHSGDGAIIGLNIYGDYIQITKPQKGVDMVSVLPLRAGYTVWSIDSYEEELAAVMIMTDGMLDYALCPYLLKLSNKSEVYTPIATFFADPFGVPNSEKDFESAKKDILEFITAEENYDSEKFFARLKEIYKKRLKSEAKDIISRLKETNYANALMQSVQDDKSIIALINTELTVDTKDNDFYDEPNWAELQEEWNRKAYPHLYSNKDEEPLSEEFESNIDNKESDEENTDVENVELVETNEDTVEEQNKSDDSSRKEKEQTTQTHTSDKNTTEVSIQQNDDSVSELSEKKTENHEQTKASSNIKNNEQSAPPKHKKPRKKSLLDKIGDVLNS